MRSTATCLRGAYLRNRFRELHRVARLGFPDATMCNCFAHGGAARLGRRLSARRDGRRTPPMPGRSISRRARRTSNDIVGDKVDLDAQRDARTAEETGLDAADCRRRCRAGSACRSGQRIALMKLMQARRDGGAAARRASARMSCASEAEPELADVSCRCAASADLDPHDAGLHPMRAVLCADR